MVGVCRAYMDDLLDSVCSSGNTGRLLDAVCSSSHAMNNCSIYAVYITRTRHVVGQLFADGSARSCWSSRVYRSGMIAILVRFYDCYLIAILVRCYDRYFGALL